MPRRCSTIAYNHFYLDEPGTERLEPRLLYTGIVVDSPLWFNIPHKHDFCEILYVVQGSGSVTIEQWPYTVHAGDLLLMNPGVLHEEHSDPNDPIYLAFLGINNFTLDRMEPDYILEQGRCPVVALGNYRSRLEQLFLELVHETSSHIRFYELISQSIVATLLLQIRRILLSENQPYEALSSECRSIKEFIDGNYNTNITLDELAKRVYISKYHASHIFKKETGLSPIRYLIEKRIENAKAMLWDSKKSIAEISLAVGYDDPVYFSQIFKKITGCPPSKYKNSFPR